MQPWGQSDGSDPLYYFERLFLKNHNTPLAAYVVQLSTT